MFQKKKGKLMEVWDTEDGQKSIKKSIRHLKKLKCSCTTNKCTNCTCANAHVSCTKLCPGCNGKCLNPHNDGGFCEKTDMIDGTNVWACYNHKDFGKEAPLPPPRPRKRRRKTVL